MILDSIANVYNEVLHFIAEITVHTLELVGIIIIIVGSIRAITQTLLRLRRREPINVMIELGRSLALALEFKMGAEIVNTVIIRDFKELGVLAIVIALRAILAMLILSNLVQSKDERARTKAMRAIKRARLSASKGGATK